MFVVLILIYVLSAFPGKLRSEPTMLNVLTVSAVFLGIRAMTSRKRVLWMALLVLGLYVLIVEVVHLAVAHDDYRWDTIFVLVFFLFMLGLMAKVVMRREEVTSDKIFASACVYLLMGIFFGQLFVLIELSSPGAFTLSQADLARLSPSLVHFSFTTLTTVGYGDISPVSPVARALSDIEAVIAQLYLAVVLARLVSLQITQGTSFDDGHGS